jgi:hypothetical protein
LSFFYRNPGGGVIHFQCQNTMSAKGLLRYRCTNAAGGSLPSDDSAAKTLQLTVVMDAKGGELQQWGAASTQSPTGSLSSDAPSSAGGSPSSGGHILEEEEEDSLDEGIEDILASSPACNLCGHRFFGTADFLDHVRMHFSTGRRQLSPSQSTVERGNGLRRRSPPSYTEAALSSASDRHSASSVNSSSSIPQTGSTSIGLKAQETVSASPLSTAAGNDTTVREPEPSQQTTHTEQQQQEQHNDSGILNSSLDYLLDLDVNSSFLHSLQQQQQPHKEQVQSSEQLTALPASQLPPNCGIANVHQPNPASPYSAGMPQAVAPQLQQSSNSHQQHPSFPDHNFTYMNVGLSPFVRQPVGGQPPFSAHYPYAAAYHAAGGLAPSFPVIQQQQKFGCFLCPASFDQRETLFSHMALHQQQHQQVGNNGSLHHFGHNTASRNNSMTLVGQQHHAMVAANQRPTQQLKRSRGQSTHAAQCSCGCRPASSNKKTRRKEEDIDAETLKQISALEWERKHG